jgi:23S rRNA pseudouridine1911/1915/1917 synthase
MLLVPPEASGARLDRFGAAGVGVSRAEFQRWIEDGRVTVDGARGSPSATLRAGAKIAVWPGPGPRSNAEPDESVQFEVLHVDDDLVVVVKPAGLVVHPAKGHPGGTLVNGLLARGLFSADEAAAPGQNERPGIVHRLDKGTTGVLVVARNPSARESLKAQFQAHTIERAYRAVVVGEARDQTIATLHGRDPKDRMRFTSRVREGKRAVTHVRVVERYEGASLVACTLETGRTHQIRMHLSETGTPVLGDPVYGRAPREPWLRALAVGLGRQALHAAVLGFVHPRTGVALRFTAPPPEDFLAVVSALQAGRRGGA